jgi:hypothetical protein
MSAPARSLPAAPNLEHLRKQAKDLQRDHRDGRAGALRRLRTHVPRLSGATIAEIRDTDLALTEAQLAIAREYGFPSWPKLVESVGPQLDSVRSFKRAIEHGDTENMRRLLAEHPKLLEHPFEWIDPEGRRRHITPIRHAFNCDQRASFDVLTGAGVQPRELQHILWCNAYNMDLPRARKTLSWGIQPNTALGVALHHAGTARHELIELLIDAGADAQDGPVLDLHRGRLASLKKRLKADPALSRQSFFDTCYQLPTSGTLLHVASAHNEIAAIDLLIAHGADIDAAGPIHEEGANEDDFRPDMHRFVTKYRGTGRQTPIYYTIGRPYASCYEAFERLLSHGPDLSVRAACLVDGRIQELTPLGYACAVNMRGPNLGRSNMSMHETRQREIDRLRELGAPEV